MSERSEQPTRILGNAGEPCRACGAALAADQRYCLNCGERRGGPRIDFRRQLGSDRAHGAENGRPQPQAAPAPNVAEGGERPQRDYAPLAAVGGIAVLGLMLLVGVLIGRGDGSGDAAPAQVVVPGVEAKQGNESEPTAEKAVPKRKAAPKKAAAPSKSARKADDAAALTTGGQGGGPVEASDEALQELEEKSPGEYSKESAKLPDEIATGGAPPPTDSKAPGGGSKGTAIE